MKGKGGGFFNPVNEGQGNNRNYSNGDKRYNNNNKNTDVQVMFLGKTTMATKKKNPSNVDTNHNEKQER